MPSVGCELEAAGSGGNCGGQPWNVNRLRKNIKITGTNLAVASYHFLLYLQSFVMTIHRNLTCGKMDSKALIERQI
jgi:hypothetical protein